MAYLEIRETITVYMVNVSGRVETQTKFPICWSMRVSNITWEYNIKLMKSTKWLIYGTVPVKDKFTEIMTVVSLVVNSSNSWAVIVWLNTSWRPIVYRPIRSELSRLIWWVGKIVPTPVTFEVSKFRVSTSIY